LIISTRDEFTFKTFGEYAYHKYNGIDFAYFINQLYTPNRFNKPKEILAVNFDKISEPKISNSAKKIKKPLEFIVNNKSLYLEKKALNEFGLKTDRLSDAFVYVKSIFTKSKPKFIDNFKIVRTDHRFNPLIKHKVYKHPNSFVSDIPYNYIDIYANADFVLTDRVHAAVISLVFSTPCIFFAKTPRSGLLDRMLGCIHDYETMTLSRSKLQKEQTEQINFLQHALKNGNH